VLGDDEFREPGGIGIAAVCGVQVAREPLFRVSR
jgi:hypothetical protein